MKAILGPLPRRVARFDPFKKKSVLLPVAMIMVMLFSVGILFTFLSPPSNKNLIDTSSVVQKGIDNVVQHHRPGVTVPIAKEKTSLADIKKKIASYKSKTNTGFPHDLPEQEARRKEEEQHSQPANQQQEQTEEQPQKEEPLPLKKRKPSKFELDEETKKRQQAVKEMFLHAWDNYEKYAWGQDEYHPLARSGSVWGGGSPMGLTILDALDTIWIMELDDIFQRCRDWVAKIEWDMVGNVNTFETTIRALGGLLSAYDLSGDPVFLENARDLGKRLLGAFDTSHPIPNSDIQIGNGKGHSPYSTRSLSEATTLQLEFAYLALKLNDSSFAQKPMEVIDVMDGVTTKNGLYSISIGVNGQLSPDRITLGARGDSFYEYLHKLWVFSGKRVPKFKRMFESTAKAIIEHLVVKSSYDDLVFIAERNWDWTLDYKMDHLVCFAGAMFAQAAEKDTPEYNPEYFELGKEITKTCHEMYVRMATGIAPEIIRFEVDSNQRSLYADPGAKHYILRPEALESIFVMYRLTGDKMYQEWGWEIFQAIEKHCKVVGGYAGLKDVTNLSDSHDDMMHTFFLAETLKYLYLLFSPPDLIPLDQYVFNTEAHPVSIFTAGDINDYKHFFGKFD